MPARKPAPRRPKAPAARGVVVVDVRDPADTPPPPPGDPLPGLPRTVDLAVRLLDQNDRQAAANRAR
ncbi:MAG TPA: hypothetical protein VMF63_05585, partial [Opitutaceae bacterium]|nr:hypothetical protein [Opitutaceae bacterium]